MPKFSPYKSLALFPAMLHWLATAVSMAQAWLEAPLESARLLVGQSSFQGCTVALERRTREGMGQSYVMGHEKRGSFFVGLILSLA